MTMQKEWVFEELNEQTWSITKKNVRLRNEIATIRYGIDRSFDHAEKDVVPCEITDAEGKMWNVVGSRIKNKESYRFVFLTIEREMESGEAKKQVNWLSSSVPAEEPKKESANRDENIPPPESNKEKKAPKKKEKAK